jgi:hypothetical protein
MVRKFRYSEPSIAKLLFSYVKQQVPCGPGFPVKFVGVDKRNLRDLNLEWSAGDINELSRIAVEFSNVDRRCGRAITEL